MASRIRTRTSAAHPIAATSSAAVDPIVVALQPAHFTSPLPATSASPQTPCLMEHLAFRKRIPTVPQYDSAQVSAFGASSAISAPISSTIGRRSHHLHSSAASRRTLASRSPLCRRKSAQLRNFTPQRRRGIWNPERHRPCCRWGMHGCSGRHFDRQCPLIDPLEAHFPSPQITHTPAFFLHPAANDKDYYTQLTLPSIRMEPHFCAPASPSHRPRRPRRRSRRSRSNHRNTGSSRPSTSANPQREPISSSLLQSGASQAARPAPALPPTMRPTHPSNSAEHQSMAIPTPPPHDGVESPSAHPIPPSSFSNIMHHINDLLALYVLGYLCWLLFATLFA